MAIDVSSEHKASNTSDSEIPISDRVGVGDADSCRGGSWYIGTQRKNRVEKLVSTRGPSHCRWRQWKSQRRQLEALEELR